MTFNTTSGRTLTRRGVFAMALVGIGTFVSLVTGCYHYKWGHPQTSFLGYPHSPILRALGEAIGFPGLPLSRMASLFVWGMDSLGIVLAVWLVGRCGLWRTAGGKIRVGVYLIAYVWGGMLCHAMQRWLHQLGPDGYPRPRAIAAQFQWPGSLPSDFARVYIDLLTIIVFVWLLLPFFSFCRARLAERASDLPTQPFALTISFGLRWTAIAAAILAWTQFLASSYAPQTFLSRLSASEAIVRLVTEQLPGQALALASVLMIALACSGRWYISVVVAVLAAILDGLGNQLLSWLLNSYELVPSPRYDALHSPPIEQWCYVLGRNFIAWVAFAAAAMAGVRFRFPAGQSRGGHHALFQRRPANGPQLDDSRSQLAPEQARHGEP